MLSELGHYALPFHADVLPADAGVGTPCLVRLRKRRRTDPSISVKYDAGFFDKSGNRVLVTTELVGASQYLLGRVDAVGQKAAGAVDYPPQDARSSACSLRPSSSSRSWSRIVTSQGISRTRRQMPSSVPSMVGGCW